MIALLALAAAATGLAAFVVLEELARTRRAARDPRSWIAMYTNLPRVPRRVSARPERLVSVLARLSRRLLPRRSESALASRLLAAGLGGRLSVADFLAIEFVGGVVLAVLGVFAGAGKGMGTALVLALALGATGFVAPRLVLGLRVRKRVDRIRAELPDALDLLAVTVRAGLGLDAAMARFAETKEGALAEEFAFALAEMRIGEGRRQALERMAERLGAREVTMFVRALVQGEQLGTSLGETLQVQAQEARRRRRTESEEKANKASVKMIFPTAIFIFPALFVVILAPAILTITQQL